MAAHTEYRELRGTPAFGIALAVLAALSLAGWMAGHHMESEGHHVTGMSNRVVWGVPHVAAVFLILAAPGALHAASIAGVFGRDGFVPFARLAGLASLSMLAGGVAVLALDLGRPERLVIALTHYQWRSQFSWNVVLYAGFMGSVMLWLVLLMRRRPHPRRRQVSWLALAWRIALTVGTASVFGVLAAREAYPLAVMIPLFFAISLLAGSALLVLAVIVAGDAAGRAPDPGALGHIGRTLRMMLAATALLVLGQHLAAGFVYERYHLERFLLAGGGPYPAAFWLGQVLLGTLLPLALLRGAGKGRLGKRLVAAALLATGGVWCQLYVIIIGGQDFPLVIVPGTVVVEGNLAVLGDAPAYAPSAPELLLAQGGFAFAALILAIGLRVLPFLPVDEGRGGLSAVSS